MSSSRRLARITRAFAPRLKERVWEEKDVAAYSILSQDMLHVRTLGSRPPIIKHYRLPQEQPQHRVVPDPALVLHSF